MALNYSLETEQAFRRLTDVVLPCVRATRPIIAEEVVAELEGPSSLWPVRTGLSKRSFSVRRRGGQDTERAYASVINTATRTRRSGTRTYAQFVERGVRQPHNEDAALRTVMAGLTAIAQRVQDRLPEATADG